MKRVSLGVLVLALISLATVTPAVAQKPVQTLDTAIVEAQLTAYAKAFAAIAAARDQTHAEMALPKNKTDAIQNELREKLQKQIDQILRDQSLTPEQYTRITYVISIDGPRRKSFEELLARATPKPDTR